MSTLSLIVIATLVAVVATGGYVGMWKRRAHTNGQQSNEEGVRPGPVFSIVSVVTGRPPPAGWPSFVANRNCYSKTHGYNSFVMCKQNETFRSEGLAPGFAKIIAVQRVLEASEEGAWVLMLDDDVMIVDMQLSVEEILRRVPPDTEVLLPQDHVEGCTFAIYAMLIKNGPIGRRFVQMWWEERPNSQSPRLAERMSCGWHDQCPMWRAVIRMLHATQGDHAFRLPLWNPLDPRAPNGEPAPAAAFETAIQGFVGNCTSLGHRTGRAPFFFESLFEFVVQTKWETTASFKRCITDNGCPRMFAAHTGFNPSFKRWWETNVAPAQGVCGHQPVPRQKVGQLFSHAQCSSMPKPPEGK